jgi:hypothetical protein
MRRTCEESPPSAVRFQHLGPFPPVVRGKLNQQVIAHYPIHAIPLAEGEGRETDRQRQRARRDGKDKEAGKKGNGNATQLGRMEHLRC